MIYKFLKRNSRSLDFVPAATREHAICTVAVTMVDLYPKESWNFVFGELLLTAFFSNSVNTVFSNNLTMLRLCA